MQSTVSLGRVGRVLGGEAKLASRSGSKESISNRATTPEMKTPTPITEGTASFTPPPTIVVNSEPDIVASAKASIQTDQPVATIEEEQPTRPSEPVAPPRRRRKAQAPTPPQPDPPALPVPTPPPVIPAAAHHDAASTASQLPSSVSAPSLSSSAAPTPVEPPQKTIHSLTRGFEFSLDLMSATKGLYVIKPQDEESTRAERRRSSSDDSTSKATDPSPPDENRTKDKVSNDPNCIAEEGESSAPSVNMFVRTRTDSGKPLSDREILEQVTVLNLDTGEQIPLSIAEDKLPQCLNPLSLHIMRLTSEYIR